MIPRFKGSIRPIPVSGISESVLKGSRDVLPKSLKWLKKKRYVLPEKDEFCSWRFFRRGQNSDDVNVTYVGPGFRKHFDRFHETAIAATEVFVYKTLKPIEAVSAASSLSMFLDSSHCISLAHIWYIIAQSNYGDNYIPNDKTCGMFYARGHGAIVCLVIAYYDPFIRHGWWIDAMAVDGSDSAVPVIQSGSLIFSLPPHAAFSRQFLYP